MKASQEPKAKSQQPILTIENLAISFKGVAAVKGVSFELEKGKTLGIVGESGSGKSVTSLAIMGLLAKTGKIDTGKIIYLNQSGEKIALLDLESSEMRKYRGNEISMIFQEPMTSLNPVFTCGYQVMESLMLHKGLDKKQATAQTIELFKKVELPRAESLLKSYPHELSGGQKQRVMIAMAIACDPTILIADEPTTALDVTVQKNILKLLRDLQHDLGMSIIFISHDLGVIAEIADQVLVLYNGNVVEHGPIKDVFLQPQHPYTQGLLACRPPLDRKLHRLPVIADFWDEFEKEKTDDIDKSKISAPKKIVEGTVPFLKVENLKTWFPIRSSWFQREKEYVKAVDDISFELYKGETLGLVGESGCGKTTLGRSILRLIEPNGGKITFDGQEITSLSAAEMRVLRKQIQIIFQDPYSSLNPRIPIGKAIMEPMIVHNIEVDDAARKIRCLDLLDKVGLEASHFDRYPHEFSGGQRQRVCIARALAAKPRFIICDESVSALDVSVQAQVLNLLKSLQDQYGFTYIFISHDLSVIRFMCDRMLVMKNGKIVEMGSTSEIYAQPKSAYTQKLLDAVPEVQF